MKLSHLSAIDNFSVDKLSCTLRYKYLLSGKQRATLQKLRPQPCLALLLNVWIHSELSVTAKAITCSFAIIARLLCLQRGSEHS